MTESRFFCAGLMILLMVSRESLQYSVISSPGDGTEPGSGSSDVEVVTSPSQHGYYQSPYITPAEEQHTRDFNDDIAESLTATTEDIADSYTATTLDSSVNENIPESLTATTRDSSASDDIADSYTATTLDSSANDDTAESYTTTTLGSSVNDDFANSYSAITKESNEDITETFTATNGPAQDAVEVVSDPPPAPLYDSPADVSSDPPIDQAQSQFSFKTFIGGAVFCLVALCAVYVAILWRRHRTGSGIYGSI